MSDMNSLAYVADNSARAHRAHGKGVPVLYVVGAPSAHDDMELRWSLRSLERYGRGSGRVVVVSPLRRDWLSDEVEQFVVEDMPNAGYKHHNILNAIMKAVDVADLRGEFSVSSDDHFWVKPVDFASVPLAARRWAIPSRYGSSPHLQTMLWRQSMADTRDFLYQHGLPTIDFQMHRNARWNAETVRERRGLFEEAMTWRFCVEPHVLAQNLWIDAHPEERMEFRMDCKISAFSGVEEWCDCLSCSDEAFGDEAFLGFMAREFGGKCRYERQ